MATPSAVKGVNEKFVASSIFDPLNSSLTSAATAPSAFTQQRCKDSMRGKVCEGDAVTTGHSDTKREQPQLQVPLHNTSTIGEKVQVM
jgi:hypothetical protein